MGFLCSLESQAMQTAIEDSGERKHCSACDVALRKSISLILCFKAFEDCYSDDACSPHTGIMASSVPRSVHNRISRKLR